MKKKNILTVLFMLLLICIPFAWMLFTGPCPAKSDGSFMRCIDGYKMLIKYSFATSSFILLWLLLMLITNNIQIITKNKDTKDLCKFTNIFAELALIFSMALAFVNRFGIDKALCMRTDMPCHHMKVVSNVCFLIASICSVIFGWIVLSPKEERNIE